ncbi:hypothetical protein PRIPAC_93181 [Pristionchus pacificus]|uniref:Uncharacterized protein n=1 Tax=Pristionchus pacificus TaxID=54126 RepID=A0A2A6BQM8_PRIPA|nr:hypothetical protein PRIPAC_93181 [Pristionchus pacificus]|eukprot:PDM68168.1 protein kinase [Pristionchus pacificus]
MNGDLSRAPAFTYDENKCVGGGAFGAVYEGILTKNNTRVCVKVSTAMQLLNLPRHSLGLPTQIILDLIGDLANALSALFDEKIVHRDIKPTNILNRALTAYQMRRPRAFAMKESLDKATAVVQLELYILDKHDEERNVVDTAVDVKQTSQMRRKNYKQNLLRPTAQCASAKEHDTLVDAVLPRSTSTLNATSNASIVKRRISHPVSSKNEHFNQFSLST